MKYNHVIKVRLGRPDHGQTKARSEAARCWNDMVRLHKYCRKRHWKWPTEKRLNKESRSDRLKKV